MRSLMFALALWQTGAQAQTTVSGISPDVAAAIAAVDASAVKTINGTGPTAGNVAVPVTTFVSGFTQTSPGLVANLPTCGGSSASVGAYAVVSNLYSAWSNTNEVMRCTSTGTLNYWRPQRTDASVSMATPNAAITLTPLSTPPVIHFTTNATSNSGSVTPSTAMAYPGEQFTLVQDGALGLFSLQVGGLLGGALNMVTGGTRTLTYSCTSATPPVCAWAGN